VIRTNSEPRNIRRVLDKDVLPAIGDKPVADVTIRDIFAITDAVKARGADQMALQTCNGGQRLRAAVRLRDRARQDTVQPGRGHRGTLRRNGPQPRCRARAS
jgi:hypothetical protein